MNCCSKENIHSGSSRAEKDFHRTCPSMLSKHELEELYYGLLQNNMDLKKTVNKQNEKIKILSTKLQKKRAALMSAERGHTSPDISATVQEQKDDIAELQRSNERLAERIKRLNMQLCSAKQFLKRPTPRGAKGVRPGAVSAKNMSTSALNLKKSDTNIGTSASCQFLDKQSRSPMTLENSTESERQSFALAKPGSDKLFESKLTATSAKPLESQDTNRRNHGENALPETFCDENRCKTMMEELQLKVANLQEELSKTHEEYSNRISRLEKEVVDRQSDNLRVASDSAARAHLLERREQQARDALAKLREVEGLCGNLTTQLVIEKSKVAELKTQVKAANMSNQMAKTIEGHLNRKEEAKEEENSKAMSNSPDEKEENHVDVQNESDIDSNGQRNHSVQCESNIPEVQVPQPNPHGRKSSKGKHRCECNEDSPKNGRKRRKSVKCNCDINNCSPMESNSIATRCAAKDVRRDFVGDKGTAETDKLNFKTTEAVSAASPPTIDASESTGPLPIDPVCHKHRETLMNLKMNPEPSCQHHRALSTDVARKHRRSDEILEPNANKHQEYAAVKEPFTQNYRESRGTIQAESYPYSKAGKSTAVTVNHPTLVSNCPICILEATQPHDAQLQSTGLTIPEVNENPSQFTSEPYTNRSTAVPGHTLANRTSPENSIRVSKTPALNQLESIQPVVTDALSANSELMLCRISFDQSQQKSKDPECSPRLSIEKRNLLNHFASMSPDLPKTENQNTVTPVVSKPSNRSKSTSLELPETITEGTMATEAVVTSKHRMSVNTDKTVPCCDKHKNAENSAFVDRPAEVDGEEKDLDRINEELLGMIAHLQAQLKMLQVALNEPQGAIQPDGFFTFEGTNITPNSLRRLSKESTNENEIVKLTLIKENFNRRESTQKATNPLSESKRSSLDPIKNERINNTVEDVNLGKRLTFTDDMDPALTDITTKDAFETNTIYNNDNKNKEYKNVGEQRNVSDTAKNSIDQDNVNDANSTEIQTGSSKVTTAIESDHNDSEPNTLNSPLHLTSSPLYSTKEEHSPIPKTKGENVSNEEQPLVPEYTFNIGDDHQTALPTDICEQSTQICTCPHAERRDVAVFRSCSGTLCFKTTNTGVSKFRRCQYCKNAAETPMKKDYGTQLDFEDIQTNQNLSQNGDHDHTEQLQSSQQIRRPSQIPRKSQTSTLNDIQTKTNAQKTKHRTENAEKTDNWLGQNNRKNEVIQRKPQAVLPDKRKHCFVESLQADSKRRNRQTQRKPTVRGPISGEIPEIKMIPDQVTTQRRRDSVHSPPQTYTLPQSDAVAHSGIPTENTDHEISSMTDLPSSERDQDSSSRGKRPPTPLSPGERKPSTTYTESSTMPTDYGSLSEGELPTHKEARRMSIGETQAKDSHVDSKPVAVQASTTARMEETLQAITAELARCRLLLQSRRGQEVT